MNSQIVFTKIYWKFVGQYFKQLKKKILIEVYKLHSDVWSVFTKEVVCLWIPYSIQSKCEKLQHFCNFIKECQ